MTCCGSNGNPFVQTLFMGASIVQFSSTVDWNGTGGDLKVELVEDNCEGNDRLYVDCNGNFLTTDQPDKFKPHKLSAPCYFYYGGFSFSGLLDNWVEIDSPTSAKMYQVTLTSPKDILDSIQIILNSYDGPVYGVPNLINVHGYLNTFCNYCGEGEFLLNYPPMGMGAPLTYTPAYGWCKSSSAGWSWNLVRSSLILLLSCFNSAYSSCIRFRGFNYIVDISQLPLLNSEIRINFENMSLSELVDYVCGIAGMEYFYELSPSPCVYDTCCEAGHFGEGPHIIRVVVSDPSTYTGTTSAKAIDAATCTEIDARLGYGVISSQIGAANCVNKYTRGIQSRNDYMAAMITGEYRRDIWQIDYFGGCDGNDSIWPYWGKDSNGNVIVGVGCDFDSADPSNTHSFIVDISHLGVGVGQWRVTLPELRCAAISESSWRTWLLAKEPDKINQLNTTAEYKIPEEGFLSSVLALAKQNDPNKGLKALDLLNLGYTEMMKKVDETTWKKGSIVYDFIRKYAEEYYGKKFMVKIPFECMSVDPDAPYSYANSWEATDGGWTEWPVLGFPNNSPYVNFFRLDDGRVGCFVRFLSNGSDILEYDDLSKDDVYPISAYEVLVRGTVEEIVWVGPNDARAVIQVSGPIKQSAGQDMLPEWLLMFKLIDAADANELKRVTYSPSNDKLHLGMADHFLLPMSAAVPLQSQRLVYGPWLASSIDNFNYYGVGSVFSMDAYGKTYYERDSSLAPWEYGSFYVMNMAGYAIASLRISDGYVSERGDITFPGGPVGTLGSIIAAGGPIINGIDVTVGRGTDAILTTYRMKTYIPDWGKMKQARVDMIRRAGRIASDVYNIHRKLAVKRYHDISIRQVEQQILSWKKAHQFSPNSSMDVFSGAAYEDPDNNEHARTSTAITEARKESVLIRPDDTGRYKNRAFVEAAGLFRPFSTRTSIDDGKYLPRFEVHDHPGGCPTGRDEYMRHNTDFCSKEQVPPIFCEEHHLPIVVGTLSPFLRRNKSVVNQDDNMICLNDGSDEIGHDIEYVARDGVYPTHMSVRHPTDNYSDTHWYRAIALKGPLVIAGWGFDIDNKPVPNQSSTYPNNPQMKFKEGWLRRPQDWKCGPVDLRWDYRRKVWTAPTPHKIVRMELQEDLCPEQCANAVLYEDQIQHNRDGNPIPLTTGCAGKQGYKVKVWSNAMRAVPRGWRIMAMFDTTYDKYYMINHDEYPLVEAILQNDMDCYNDGIAIITDVAGGNSSDYDPCSTFPGKTIVLKNTLGQPICAGSKVLAWVNKFVCEDDGIVGPKINNCEYQCYTISKLEGVVVQAEFHPYCFVVNVELIELMCSYTNYRYASQYVTLQPYGDVYTNVTGDISGYITYSNVQITGDYVTIPYQTVTITSGTVDVGNFCLDLPQQNICFEGKHATFDMSGCYIDPFECCIDNFNVTIPSQYITIPEHTVNVSSIQATIGEMTGIAFGTTIHQYTAITDTCTMTIPQLYFCTSPAVATVEAVTGTATGGYFDISHIHPKHNHTGVVTGNTDLTTVPITLNVYENIECDISGGYMNAPVTGEISCYSNESSYCGCDCELINASAYFDLSSLSVDCDSSYINIDGETEAHKHSLSISFTTNDAQTAFNGIAYVSAMTVQIEEHQAYIPALCGQTESTTTETCYHTVYLPDITIPNLPVQVQGQTVTMTDVEMTVPSTSVQTEPTIVEVEGVCVYTTCQDVNIHNCQVYIEGQCLNMPAQQVCGQNQSINVSGGTLTIPEQKVHIDSLEGQLTGADIEITGDFSASSTFTGKEMEIEFKVKTIDTSKTYRYDICICIQQMFLQTALGDIVCGNNPECPDTCNPTCYQYIPYCNDYEITCESETNWIIDNELLEVN